MQITMENGGKYASIRKCGCVCVCVMEKKREMTVSGVNYVVWSACVCVCTVMPPLQYICSVYTAERLYLCVLYIYKREPPFTHKETSDHNRVLCAHGGTARSSSSSSKKKKV